MSMSNTMFVTTPTMERPEPERGQTAPAQWRSLISATTQCLLYLGKHCENITQGPQKCVILEKQGRCNPANLNNAMPKSPNYILHVILNYSLARDERMTFWSFPQSVRNLRRVKIARSWSFEEFFNSISNPIRTFIHHELQHKMLWHWV